MIDFCYIRAPLVVLPILTVEMAAVNTTNHFYPKTACISSDFHPHFYCETACTQLVLFAQAILHTAKINSSLSSSENYSENCLKY